MNERLDMDMADVLQANRRRTRARNAITATEIALDADRTSPRWQRLRGALCPEHGLRESLDEYADRIFVAIRNATGPGSAFPRQDARDRGQTKGA